VAKISPARQDNLLEARIADSKFQKRSQLFIRTHNETLSVITMRVSNEGCSVWILPQLVAPEWI
jgi:hypothetical protein